MGVLGVSVMLCKSPVYVAWAARLIYAQWCMQQPTLTHRAFLIATVSSVLAAQPWYSIHQSHELTCSAAQLCCLSHASGSKIISPKPLCYGGARYCWDFTQQWRSSEQFRFHLPANHSRKGKKSFLIWSLIIPMFIIYFHCLPKTYQKHITTFNCISGSFQPAVFLLKWLHASRFALSKKWDEQHSYYWVDCMSSLQLSKEGFCTNPFFFLFLFIYFQSVTEGKHRK